MIRRSFRIGLWLGLLAGIAFAAAKIFKPKPEPSSVLDLGSPGASLAPSPSAWPPLEAPVPTPTPVQVPEPEVAPVVATEEPGLVLIGDEPLQEPEPESAPAAPVVKPTKPVSKRPTVKKAAPKKESAAAPVGDARVTKKMVVKKKLPPWVDPDGTICPQTHPVKGKLSSMIFQQPGNFAYDRTTPDRCYQSADAAEDDGLRAAKR
ncbi:MAG: hypothetical protein QOC92_4734 [Acidimicrobiaceae bacterium]